MDDLLKLHSVRKSVLPEQLLCAGPWPGEMGYYVECDRHSPSPLDYALARVKCSVASGYWIGDVAFPSL